MLKYSNFKWNTSHTVYQRLTRQKEEVTQCILANPEGGKKKKDSGGRNERTLLVGFSFLQEYVFLLLVFKDCGLFDWAFQ